MGELEKVPMESKDLVQARVEQMKALFPEVVTEGEDGAGINFEKLRLVLGDEVTEGDERYAFTWPGKRDAIRQSQTTSTATLRPAPEESVNWDSTQNLYIEGDNLEVLKLLQRAYHGKVKLIYIDPPYNTGKDFVYHDAFGDTVDNYRKQAGLSGQSNADTSGRFHSDWCSMMYPRLRLAHELLSDDGAICISIDENEVVNLRCLCNEVFGEKNFIVQIIWRKRSTPPNDQVIGAAHEYIVVYCKNIDDPGLNLRMRDGEALARYKNPDNHPKGPWMSGDLSANVKGGRFVSSLNYPIVNPNTGEEHYPPHDGNWRFNREKMQALLDNDEIYFGADGRGRPKLKRFLCDVKQGITYTSLWDFVPLNTQGSVEMTELFGNLAVFDNPKPVDLIIELLKLGSHDESLILDFFSGSGTIAHAVMKLNANQPSSRRYIAVQLPEATVEASVARNEGFANLCEIGKERIRRAGAKIAAEVEESNRQLKFGEEPKEVPDIGFRVLKLDESGIQRPEDGQLLIDRIKPGRTDLDIIFEMMLKWGLELTYPVEEDEIEGYPVYSIAAGELICCMQPGLTVDVLEAIAARSPRRVFLLDSVVDDTIKLNALQIFKRVEERTQQKIDLRTV